LFREDAVNTDFGLIKICCLRFDKSAMQHCIRNVRIITSACFYGDQGICRYINLLYVG
jgi:hypothetical protein